MAINPKNPSTLLFWNDLANDEELKSCSRAARGLWTTECLPKAAAQHGVVQIGMHPCVWNDDLPRLLANSGGGTAEEVLELLTELVNSGAVSVDDSGRLYNRRMVRASGLSKVRSEAGTRGAEAANAKRQKSGKGVGKESGKPVGKDAGKHSGKTDGGETGLSDGNETTNLTAGDNDGRQNSSNDAGKDDGKDDGKSPPSSCFSLQASSPVTTTESLIERSRVCTSTPAGGGADAPDADDEAQPGLPLGTSRSREARIIAAWNAAADIVNEDLGHTEWARVMSATPTRKKLIKKLLTVHDIEAVDRALDNAMANPWARGEVGRTGSHENWRFNFDYFLRMDAFTRFLEAPKGSAPQRRPTPPTTGRMAALHTVRENLRRKETEA
ncbi:MAG: hypothetical protein FD144_2651 [Rhodospirillaceae bacterium]|nr:MAG: hypothetical protein FD144_2651 [Rhodospirillaceae bacterium]